MTRITTSARPAAQLCRLAKYQHMNWKTTKGEKMNKALHGKKWYRPREIARLGLIKNSTGGDNVDSNYNFILVQIKKGRLEARNYSESDRVPYWLVSEDAIQKYYKTVGII